MTRELLGGIASVALLAGGLAACDRHQNVALQNRTPQEPASARMAQADTTAPAPGYAPVTGPSVPVMTPTGDMNPAVKPARPSERSQGASPQMTPTGDKMPAYVPHQTAQ